MDRTAVQMLAILVRKRFHCGHWEQLSIAAGGAGYGRSDFGRIKDGPWHEPAAVDQL